MKRILTIAAALSCLGAVLVSSVKAHDGTKCEKKSKGIIVIPNEGDDSCSMHFYWDGSHYGLKGFKGLEDLKELDGLKALKGLDTSAVFDDLGEALDQLYDDLDHLDEYQIDLDLNLDELEASLDSFQIHIPPVCSLNVPLPPAVRIQTPLINWDWHVPDVWTDNDSLSDEEQIRLEAIRALGRLDDETTIPMLEKILKEEEHPVIRGKALAILGRIDDRRVVPILGDLAKNDPDARLRKRAIRYVGQSRDKRALDILKEILEK